MQLEAKKYLYDVQRASGLILDFTAGKSFEDYQLDIQLRSAVERQFEIIGEALTQLARLENSPIERISEHRRIIAFRNILIHGYALVDNGTVWNVVEADLLRLREEVSALLAED